jgi:hypothetical protein
LETVTIRSEELLERFAAKFALRDSFACLIVELRRELVALVTSTSILPKTVKGRFDYTGAEFIEK